MRDDLPEIVRRVRAHGFDFVQLNTNGIRLAIDPDFLAALVEAGLDCVFLQFDGVDDAVHKALRGARLSRLKHLAIRRCREAGVGVVLVPTLVAGSTTTRSAPSSTMPPPRCRRYAPSTSSRSPISAGLPGRRARRGGDAAGDHRGAGRPRRRYPALRRLPPRLAGEPLLLFSGRFVVDAAGLPVSRGRRGALVVLRDAGLDGARRPDRVLRHDAAEPRRRSGAALRRRPVEPGGGADGHRRRRLRRRPRRAGVPVGLSAMVFQDAWTLDLERSRQCQHHVAAAAGRMVPFCAYNLIDLAGRSLHRPAAVAAERQG